MTVTANDAATPTILVVDDEQDMRELARAVLEVGGFSVVDEAADGSEALDRFQHLDPPPVPAVVLLDIRMPGLTGLQVAQQMLAQHPDQVIVLFSAYIDADVEAEARAIGVAACVSKMDVARLPTIIRDLLPSR